MPKVLVTKNGLQNLNEQIHELEAEVRDCNRKMGESANLDNDLRENPEFLALRTKAEYELPAKLQELSGILTNYSLIENQEALKKSSYEYVEVGTEVILKDEDGKSRAITILGYGDSDPQNNVVSYQAPIARTLLGCELGEFVQIPSKGRLKDYEIADVRLSSLITVEF